ncbi:MAG: hypothetical protein LIR46_08890 [Bacteroidota bacterium]|nr:hypothetical protein [Bacteroidota bacterium]
MPISANTLFHFTRDIETLLSILKSKFYPRLCLEQRILPKSDLRLAIPMVCFCDIPLSQISEHSLKYGEYAIGIKKDWAINQGVSPILYVHDKSLILNTVLSEIKATSDDVLANPTGCASERMRKFVDAVCMMKPYEGYDERIKKSIRYYDEREWRYVPSRENGDQFVYITEALFHDERVREKLNSENEKYGVEFNPDVINYLIVANDKDVLTLKHEIETIKGAFPYNSVQLLMTRIISMERIREDM